jgi:oligosaccharide repeat unit polymerase
MKLYYPFFVFFLYFTIILIGGFNIEILTIGGVCLFGLSIFGGFYLNRNFVFFEPINLFNFFSIGAFISIIYYYFYGFSKSEYITLTNFKEDIDWLFVKAIYFSTIGLIMANIGYFIFKNNFKINITQDFNISDLALKVTIVLFLTLCYLNFSYNVLIHAGGNIFVYLSNVSLRTYEFQASGTSFFYNFGFIAPYLYLYLCLKKNKISYKFYFVFLSIIIIKFSMGRLLHTVNYTISILAFQYFYNYYKLRYFHIKYMIGMLSLVFLGIFMYFLRLLSSLNFNNLVNQSFTDQLLDFVKVDSLFNFLIEKGNIPNIPILMKIIDSWESDIGFYYGKSFITWIYNSFPASLRPLEYQSSFVIKNTWYIKHIGGGSLPPTGIGEMYLNFGFLGVFFGMFLFGAIMAKTYNLLKKLNNIWYLMIYTQILVYFFAIYPKGEFDNMSLFYIFPFVFTYIFLLFFSKIFQTK